VLASETKPATVVIPAQPILNGGLEDYKTTGNLLPWNIKTPAGGSIQTINGVNPCTAAGVCAGGSIVIRAYPPTTAGSVSFVQDFQARPSTTYAVSFVYRCLNFDSGSAIDVLYAGNRVGGAPCNSNGAAFVAASGILFTTDATGRGQIEIRLKSSGSTPYLYFYADDFQAKAV